MNIKKESFIVRRLVVAQETYRERKRTSEAIGNMCKENIKEYKICHKRERDIMWMKYRHLRELFDKIEQTHNFIIELK